MHILDVQALRITQHVTEIYLDNNATTRPLPEVVAAVVDAMTDNFGNPSSGNRSGQRARQLLMHARESVSRLIACDPHDLHFTSGATESNNWVVSQLVQQPGDELLTSSTEHSSIASMRDHLESKAKGFRELPVDEFGRVSAEAVRQSLTPRTRLVAIQWVNSETGTLQPVMQIAAECRTAGVPFLVDASQAVGRLSTDVNLLKCDFLTFSGHKLHAPQGVGAIYVRPGAKLLPLIFGGSQESGLRAGTENLPGIVGFGVAARHRVDCLDAAIDHLQSLRNEFERDVIAGLADVSINGDVNNRVVNTSNLRFEGVDGEALVARLDQQGVRCSQSSACTNHRPEPSYVLRAMGLTDHQGPSWFRKRNELKIASLLKLQHDLFSPVAAVAVV
jgi:cysteine desulfurase